MMKCIYSFMCTLLDQIHDFVPCKMQTAKEIFLAFLKAEAFHQLLIGGDQMIATHCCGSVAAHYDNDTRRGHLHGSYNCFNI